DLDELNMWAKRWRAHFNATAMHSRHGKTRSALWMTIRQEQLVKVPSVEVCRQLAVAEPEARKVNSKLRVSFQGAEYDVSMVPHVLVGDRLMITRNPWASDAAQVVATDAARQEVTYVVPAVVRDEFGFDETAPV